MVKKRTERIKSEIEKCSWIQGFPWYMESHQSSIIDKLTKCKLAIVPFASQQYRPRHY